MYLQTVDNHSVPPIIALSNLWLPSLFVPALLYIHRNSSGTLLSYPLPPLHSLHPVNVKFSKPSFLIKRPRNFIYLFPILSRSVLLVPISLKTFSLPSFSPWCSKFCRNTSVASSDILSKLFSIHCYIGYRWLSLFLSILSVSGKHLLLFQCVKMPFAIPILLHTTQIVVLAWFWGFQFIAYTFSYLSCRQPWS